MVATLKERMIERNEERKKPALMFVNKAWMDMKNPTPMPQWGGDRGTTFLLEHILLSPLNQKREMVRLVEYESAEEMRADGWAMDYRRDHKGMLYGAMPIGYEPKKGK